jgi:hypothetical protein
LKKILLICSLVTLGCKKQNNHPWTYSVPAEYQSYISSFIQEAAIRGHTYNINNLIIQYNSTLPPEFCAQSNVISSENNVQKIIFINPMIQCWQNDLQLETLIFHELGHCILGRSHDSTYMPKGDPKSIMIKNDITVYSPCIYPIGDSCNKQYRRAYYLDELFDPNTPIPSWGK